MDTIKTFSGFLLTSALLLQPAGGLDAQPQEDAGDVERAQLTLDELRTFTDVFNQARRNYVEPVEDRTLLDAAIRGMLTDLDPHSSYLTPEEYSELKDSSKGRYSGIGVRMDVGDGRIVIDAVIDDSPADRAGINPGDVITAMEGEAVKGRLLPDAIGQMDGDPGTDLRLTVLTPDGEERELLMTREYLLMPTLGFEWLDDGWGYFRMTQFHQESANHLRDALDSIAAEGKVLEGLFIDLRNNPGGVLQPAVELADGFLEGGRIVSVKGRNTNMQMEFDARPGDWLPGIPVVLLVDRGSASASEVLAGALQDHGRALVVGERTFGKGSVQSVLPLRNGGAIKLTTARYYTPNGRSIQARGILPDVEVTFDDSDEPDARRREADLDHHLDLDGIEDGDATAVEPIGMEFPVEEILEVLDAAGMLESAEPEAGDESA
jgi:carboxyl-terminal processing protease